MLSIHYASSKIICSTCGTHYSPVKSLPALCLICADDRQYIGHQGQQWISWQELTPNRSIRFQQLDDRVYDLRLSPNFAIGQKAHLILSKSGNILWDCLPFIDEPAVAYIQSKGGIQAIAISHPHYYSLMTEWSRLFNCPIYLHQHDAQWVMDDSPSIHYWEGQALDLWDGIRLIHTGGHFPGSCVLHLPPQAHRGILLTGDTIYVAQDRTKVSFMYSYPNLIPLAQKDIVQIRERLAPIPFETVYGAFEGQIIPSNGKAIVNQSIDRYLRIFNS
jgi:glyoxylase-like metal-dependent hydrolase (beta-lactamase superfamily II)